MDTKDVERLLAADAAGRPESAPTGPPGPECLPMPILADIAAGRLQPTSAQDEHIHSCLFCAGLVDRLRPGIGWGRIVRYSLWPTSVAACLAIGFGAGTMLSPSGSAWAPDDMEVINQAADVYNHYYDRPKGPKRIDPRYDELTEELEEVAEALRDVLELFYERQLADPDARTGAGSAEDNSPASPGDR